MKAILVALVNLFTLHQPDSKIAEVTNLLFLSKIKWIDQDSNPQPLHQVQMVCLHPKFQISAVDSACQ